MRVKAPVPPLIYALFSADSLLDLLKTQKDGRGNFPLTVYHFDSVYYAVVSPKLSRRAVCREFLSAYGRFLGSGPVLEAFLAEHGKALHRLRP